MVKITVCGSGELQSSETDIVQSFVINDHALVSVLDQLMDGESCVVRFNNSVRNFGRRDNGEGLHDSIRIFFSLTLEMSKVPIPDPVPPPKE